MTKKRLHIMIIIDMIFILMFSYATVISLNTFELYFTITYFCLALFTLALMSNRIYSYYTENTKECNCSNHSEDILKEIKIKYFTDGIKPLEYIDGKSDWIDLRASETVELKAGEFKLIPLGIGMKLPKGYEANIVPRSSTFKNYGIIQTNSFAVIDNTYCGDEDMWRMPVYATRDTVINKNDRICQFRINKNQPCVKFETVEKLESINRGGFGITGKN